MVVVVHQGLTITVQRSDLCTNQDAVNFQERCEIREWDRRDVPESNSLSRFSSVASDEVVINCS